MGLIDLIRGIELLGLCPPFTSQLTISVEHTIRKITNPPLAAALGGTNSVPLIEEAERCFDLLDSHSETGEREYLRMAQAYYVSLLGKLSLPTAMLVTTAMADIFNYPIHGRLLALLLRHGFQMSDHELVEYLMRRSAHVVVYGILLGEVDSIRHPALNIGLRIRQILWDIADDIRTVRQDGLSTRVNSVLFAGYDWRRLNMIAVELYIEGRRIAGMAGFPAPLIEVIAREYTSVQELLVGGTRV